MACLYVYSCSDGLNSEHGRPTLRVLLVFALLIDCQLFVRINL